MATTGGSCGVGGWGGPLPGDPSSNSILSATPAFGGIDVSWTYPTTNPNAVAYTLLYRGISSNFALAGTPREIGGSFFYDKLDTATRYYYWIRFISVNGTPGDLIGPASAVAKPTIEAMLELLTGQIDAGFLATSLRNQIDQIQAIALNLAGEVVSRENGEVTLSQAMVSVQAGVAQALTFLANEQTSRVDGDSVLATSLNLVAATYASNLAAVQTTLRAEIAVVDGRVTTVATAVTTAAATAASNLAAAQTTLNASITTVDGRVTTLATHVDTVEAATATNLAAAQSTLNASIATVDGRVTTVSSAVTTAQTTANTGVANAATAQSGVISVAAAQTALSTSVTTIDGKVTAIGALYTAKVTVNGLVGGFGIYNTGAEVEAGFDVDKFWIGRTSGDKRKPFIVSDGVVYIDEAAILSLTANKITAGTLGAALVFAGKLLVGASAARAGTSMTGSGAVINSDGTFSMGNATTNITFDGTTMYLNGQVVSTRNLNASATTQLVAGSFTGTGRSTLGGLLTRTSVVTIGSITTSSFGDGRVQLLLGSPERSAVSSWEFYSLSAEASCSPGFDTTIAFNIKRNGSVIHTYGYTYGASGVGPTLFDKCTLIIDTPGPGVSCTYQYEIVTTTSGATNHAHQICGSNYSLLEFKK